MRLRRRPCRVPPTTAEKHVGVELPPPSIAPFRTRCGGCCSPACLNGTFSKKSSAGCNKSSLVWRRKLSRVQLAPGVLRIKVGTSAPKADSRRLGGPQEATPKVSYVERSEEGDRENLERRNIKSCCLPANSQSAYGKRWVVPTNHFYRKPD